MVTVRLLGGLGNQMFQYALGRTLAAKLGTPLKLDLAFLMDRSKESGLVHRNYDLAGFNISATIASQSEVPFVFRMHGKGALAWKLDGLRRRLLRSHGCERRFRFDPSILEAGQGTYLEGYWQSHKYFESAQHLIRADFVPARPLPEDVRSLLDVISTQQAVCVHVRRGDFMLNPRHGTMQREYFSKAWEIIKTRPHGRVYVFSDDVEWCRKEFDAIPDCVFVGDDLVASKEPAHHLLLMSACSSFIIANSSFSWWAAWLSRGPSPRVVAPRTWFADNSLDTSDLCPEDWVRI